MDQHVSGILTILTRDCIIHNMDCIVWVLYTYETSYLITNSYKVFFGMTSYTTGRIFAGIEFGMLFERI